MLNERSAPVAEQAAPAGPRDVLAWNLIHLSTMVRRAASQRLRRMFDMTMIEWLIITHLAAEAPLSLTALAHNACIDPQRTSLAVGRLAEKALVLRTQNPSNRREAQVELTPRGRAVFNAVIENWLGKELAHGMSDTELAQANDLLARLATRADQILSRELKGGV